VSHQPTDAKIERYKDLEIEGVTSAHKKYQKLQQFGRILGLLIIVLALLGTFGDGFMSRVKKEGKKWHLEYEKMGYQNTNLFYHLTIKDLKQDDKLEVRIKSSILNDLHFQRVLPDPSKTILGAGWTTFEFNISPIAGNRKISLHFKPEKNGIFRSEIGVAGESPVEIKQIILP
jgi:hypothetical protein